MKPKEVEIYRPVGSTISTRKVYESSVESMADQGWYRTWACAREAGIAQAHRDEEAARHAMDEARLRLCAFDLLPEDGPKPA